MSASTLLEYLEIFSGTFPVQYFLIFQSEKVIGIVKSLEGLKLKFMQKLLPKIMSYTLIIRLSVSYSKS